MTKPTNSNDRWAVCKAAAAVTGVRSEIFYKHFDKLDEDTVNAAIAASADETNPGAAPALHRHIVLIDTRADSEEAGDPPEVRAIEDLDLDLVAVPKDSVKAYANRLNYALEFISRCDGPAQAAFILEQASKAFPADTSPAFKSKK